MPRKPLSGGGKKSITTMDECAEYLGKEARKKGFKLVKFTLDRL